MTTKATHSRFIPALFLILLVFGTAVLLFLSNRLDHTDNRFDTGEMVPFDENWQLSGAGAPASQITLPFSLSADYATLTTALPESLPPDAVLSIPTAYQSLAVSLNGEVLYSAPEENFFGSLLHVIPVPPDSEGQTITLSYKTIYPSWGMYLGRILLGSRSAVLFNQLEQDSWSLIVSLIILIIGFLMVVTSCFFKGVKGGRYRFISLGSFGILAALWILSDSSFFQFISLNTTFGVLLSFYSFTLMGVPMLQYIKMESDERYSRAYDLATLILLLNFLLNVGLSAVSILWLPRLLPITHLLLVGSIFLFLWTVVHRWVICKEREFSGLIAAFSLLCVSGLVDLVRFYIHPADIDNSLFFKMGLVIFIAVLGFTSIRENLALFRDAVHIEIYKKLAFTDTTTQLGNRTAYERDLESIRTSLPVESLTIVAFDLNNLKRTNDTLGHSAGDTLIMDSGVCIRESFEGCACYRIGGDEFSVIARNLKHAHLNHCLDAFDEDLRRYNEAHAPKLDIAVGYSRGPVHTAGDLEELLRQADRAMYACKARCHKS